MDEFVNMNVQLYMALMYIMCFLQKLIGSICIICKFLMQYESWDLQRREKPRRRPLKILRKENPEGAGAWAFAGVPGSWLAVTLDASPAQETSVGGDGKRAWKEVGGTVAESSCGEH